MTEQIIKDLAFLAETWREQANTHYIKTYNKNFGEGLKAAAESLEDYTKEILGKIQATDPAPPLLAALRPFTRLWQPGMEADPDDKTAWLTDSGPVTVGDLRAARAAIAAAEGE